MAALETKDLVLPREVITEMSQIIQEKSVVASLAGSEIETFADRSYMVFTKEPEAEVVGEGKAKGGSGVEFEPITAEGFKTQVTVRTTEEVKWADDDNQLKVVELLKGSLAGALARAYDAIILHATNPRTKEKLTGVTGLVDLANQVTATGKIQADLDGIADPIVAKYEVTGIALDRLFANSARKLRNDLGAKLYPELGMNLDPSSLDGLRAVVSGSVSNSRYIPTNVQAIVGNWELIKLGLVRNIGVTMIEYGDPDGLGDLKRYNQIAFRAEAYFSYANFDPEGFAVLRSSTDNGGGDDGGDGGDGDDTKTKSSK